MANTILAKMAVEIAANTSKFNTELSKTSNSLKSFTGGIGQIAASVGIAFGTQQILQFGAEITRLAGEADGVRAAFSKLPNSTRLMNDLKDATHNTVGELGLMKRTVQAANFGISLSALPKLLEFASLRAQQTGQSVDYLVDSIVTGIGRKSPLILDNLGISAVALKDKMNGVSLATADVGTVADAVGAIASEQLELMGKFSDNTTTKVAELESAWENFKISFGTKLNSTGVFGGITDGLTDILNTFSGRNDVQNFVEKIALSFNAGERDVKKFNNALKELKDSGQDLSIAQNTLEGILNKLKNAATVGPLLQKTLKEIGIEIRNINNNPIGPDVFKFVPDGFFKAKQKDIDTLTSLKETLKSLNDEYEIININDRKRLASIGQEIIKTEKLIDRINKLRKEQKLPPIVAPIQFEFGDLSVDIEGLLKNRFSGGDPFQLVLPIEIEPEIVNDEAILGPIRERLEAQMIDITAVIQQGTADAITSFAETLGKGLAGEKVDYGKNILESIAKFAGNLGKLLIASGIATIAAEKLLANPYTAVAAGVALVAISAALASSISSSSKSTFGGGGSSYSAKSRASIDGTKPQELRIAVETITLKGQDIEIALGQVRKNNKFTRG